MADTFSTFSSTASGVPALGSETRGLDGDQGLLATSLVSTVNTAQAVAIQAADLVSTGASADSTSAGNWPIYNPALLSADGNVVAALAYADAATTAEADGIYGDADSVIGLSVGDDTVIIGAVAGNAEQRYFNDALEIGTHTPALASAIGAYAYLIDLGADDDLALVNASTRASSSSTSVAIHSSTINAGDGSDVIHIEARSEKESPSGGLSQSMGLLASTIISSSGDTWLQVEAEASAWGYAANSTIPTQVVSVGAGQSTIQLGGSDGHDASIQSSAYLNQSLPGTASSTGLSDSDLVAGNGGPNDSTTDVGFENLWFSEDWDSAYTEDPRLQEDRYSGTFSNRLDITSEALALGGSSSSVAAIGNSGTGTIATGSNSDFVQIASYSTAGRTNGSSALSSGVENYDIELGDGTDYLKGHSDATGQLAQSSGISQTTISAGAGNDLVNWSANAGGGWGWGGNPSTGGSWASDSIQAGSSARAVVAENSLISLGSGRDGIQLNSSANRVEQAEASGVINSTLDLGAELGDQLRIYSSAEGRTSALAVGLQDSTLQALTLASTSGTVAPPPNNGSIGGSWWWDALIDGADVEVNSWSSSRDSSLAIAALGTTNGGTIEVGAANDRVRLNASAQGIWDWQANSSGNRFVTAELASAIAAQDYRIAMGDGHDDLQLSSWARGNETLAIGAVRSELDLGSGDDRLNVWATTTDNINLDPAIGLLDTDVSGGDGNDQVNINANANGRGVLESYGLLEIDNNASVDLGSDDDRLNIWASASGTAGRRASEIRDQQGNIIDSGDDQFGNQQADSVKAIGISGYDVRLGGGDNYLNVGSNASGAVATSIAVRDAVITAADGSDQVSVNASTWDTPSGSEDPVVALLGTTVDLGGGADTISISANSNGLGNREAIALMGSGLVSDALNTGSGADTVNIWANATGLNDIQAAAQGANFSSGGGQWEDTITSSTATAFGALGYRLDLGSDDDRLDVNIWSRANETVSVGFSQSSIDMGTDNDEANIWVSTTDNVNYDPAIGLHQSVFNAGDGNDSLHISAHSRGSGVLEAHGLLGDEGGESDAVLDMGSGEDAVTINAHVNWRNNTVPMTPGPQVLAQGISHYNVNLGDGNTIELDQYNYDDAALRANVSLFAEAGAGTTMQSVDLMNVVVQHATLVGGTGDDWIDLNGSLRTEDDGIGRDERTSIGLLATDVITGAGADRLNLWVSNDAEGQLETFGLVGDDDGTSQIDLGDNADVFSVNVFSSGSSGYAGPASTTSEVIGVDGYTIQTGIGNDTFNLDVNNTHDSQNTSVEGIINSVIELGDGEDAATVQTRWNGNTHNPASIALRNSEFNLGAGNDTAQIAGQVRNSTLDGGAGNDLIEINGDYINLSRTQLNTASIHFMVRYTTSSDTSTFHQFEVLNTEDVRINNQSIGSLPTTSLQLMLDANTQPAALVNGFSVRPEHQFSIESAAVAAVKQRNSGSLVSVAAPLAEAARSAVSSGMSQRIQRELRAAEELDPFEFVPPPPPPSTGGGGGGALASPRESSRDRDRRSTGDRGRSGRGSGSSRGGALSEGRSGSSSSRASSSGSTRGGRSSRGGRSGGRNSSSGRRSRLDG